MGDAQVSLTGTELVERLRTDELESLRSEVAAGRRDHILRALDQRGIAQELIRQQHTGRYPFELLQNADDAAADSAGGTVRFHPTHDALIVAGQGSGFGSEEIRTRRTGAAMLNPYLGRVSRAPGLNSSAKRASVVSIRRGVLQAHAA